MDGPVEIVFHSPFVMTVPGKPKSVAVGLVSSPVGIFSAVRGVAEPIPRPMKITFDEIVTK